MVNKGSFGDNRHVLVTPLQINRIPVTLWVMCVISMVMFSSVEIN